MFDMFENGCVQARLTEEGTPGKETKNIIATHVRCQIVGSEI
jgi:hypothetical protein